MPDSGASKGIRTYNEVLLAACMAACTFVFTSLTKAELLPPPVNGALCTDKPPLAVSPTKWKVESKADLLPEAAKSSRSAPPKFWKPSSERL